SFVSRNRGAQPQQRFYEYTPALRVLGLVGCGGDREQRSESLLTKRSWQRLTNSGSRTRVKRAETLDAPKVECALDSGQFQAAVLTGCWAWRSSYCAGLR